MKSLVRRLPAALFVLVLVFSFCTAYHFAYHIIDSDAASELVLGKLLAGQNAIVTTNWIYSSEIRFFGTNLIYMPLCKLLDDWHMVRLISIILFQLLLAGSYYYLSRRMKMSRNAYFISVSLMLLPASVVYGRIVLYHNYYVPCFAYGFLIAGLYLSILEHQGQKRQALRITAVLLLPLMSCLNGFRQIPAVMIPLLATACIAALRTGRHALADIPRRQWAGVGLAGAIFAAGLAGLCIYTFLLPQYFQCRNMTGSVVALPTAKNLRNLLVGYLSLFGFQEGRVLFSGGGLLAVLSVFSAAVLLIASLSQLRRRGQPADFMGLFYPVAMLCMTGIFLLLLGNENYPQYYLPAYAWVFPFLGLQMDRLPSSVRRLTGRQAAVVLACACLLCNGAYNNLYYLDPDGKQVQYDIGIDIDALDHLQDAIDFIEENELDVGYAEFWSANIATEATNGRTAMIPIDYDTEYNVLVYHDYLTSLQNHSEDFIENKSVFLLATLAQSGYFSATELAPYGILAYEDAYYRIYLFDFPAEVWDYLNQ